MPIKGTTRPRRKVESKNLLIGAYLKHARLNQRRSLRQLSNEVGCSESFLSKVENDKLRPSLAMLHRIVSALGVSIGKLFSSGEGVDSSTFTVVRANDRPILKTGHMRSSNGITLESLVPMSTAVLLEANIHRVAQGGSSRGFIQHQGEEMGFLLEGNIELNVQGKKVTLRKGDTFFFQSHLKHGYRNIGKTEAQIVWINTPQSF